MMPLQSAPSPPLPPSAACAMAYTADTLVLPLTRALEAYKGPSYKNGVMEFWVLFVGADKATGVPTSSMHVRQASGCCGQLRLLVLAMAAAGDGGAAAAFAGGGELEPHSECAHTTGGVRRASSIPAPTPSPTAAFCVAPAGSGWAVRGRCCWISPQTCALWRPRCCRRCRPPTQER